MSKKIVNKGRKSLCGWSEIWDDNKQKFYYHDPTTNKTSWKHPKEMGIFPQDSEQETQKQESTNSPTVTEERVLQRSSSSSYVKDEKPYKRVIYGFASKLGEINKAWKTRYFVLYTDGEMEYYDKVPRPKSNDLYVDIAFHKGIFKGSINVTTTKFTINKGIKKDYAIEIELKDRMFFMAFESKEDLGEWKSALQSVGCEFFDVVVPTKKELYQLKKKENKEEAKIKRNMKGRAYELGIRNLKDTN